MNKRSFLLSLLVVPTIIGEVLAKVRTAGIKYGSENAKSPLNRFYIVQPDVLKRTIKDGIHAIVFEPKEYEDVVHYCYNEEELTYIIGRMQAKGRGGDAGWKIPPPPFKPDQEPEWFEGEKDEVE